ncbi:MAG: hypothetical protein OXG27_04595 [Chloroflexi bacterium]|nr:hypothetical protein [Chloroflexota bacterium]
MSDNDTLLAHLVPTLTSRHEDTATEALAFILRKSKDCRAALGELISVGGVPLQPIVRFETQVQYGDGCRPDMVGYAEGGITSLIVESKFWASLLSGQASGYFRHLDPDAAGALMFICPEARAASLWHEVVEQMEGADYEMDQDPTDHSEQVRRARILVSPGSAKRIVMISWARLLRILDGSSPDPAVKSDIFQLKGLAQAQDDEAFRPLLPEEIDNGAARRIRHFNRIVNSAVDRGHQDEWLTVSGFKATPQEYGYGRWFRFNQAKNASWFGVNHYRWGENGRTPLWVKINDDDMPLAEDKAFAHRVLKGGNWWVPVELKTGIPYDAILDDVASQLERINDLIGKALPPVAPPLDNEG